ncbi:fibronectin type III domain-containing protein [Paenibacillus methanolicus]|uniref:fibronectin type III domain-containing protein n=1 Tax=Paenibacillus methanolicus TaxID=582686 RepID=UPI001FE8A684|nr:fibronectin type III domain-containing protein [Paenibacillus methanolicus]
MNRLANIRQSLKTRTVALAAGVMLASLIPSLVSASSTAALVDTQAPTAPTNLKFTSGNSTSLSMKWEAASDNVGVVAYEIYRTNYGVLAGVVSGSTLTFTDTGLNPGTPYSYSVKAVDADGNRSGWSNPIGITLPNS